MTSDDVSQGEIEDIRAKLIAHPLVQDALKYLREKLPKTLKFHGPSHTDDVLNEVISFAALAKLSERELELLAIAAAFHDTGYVVDPDNHEQESAKLAVEVLRNTGGFSEQEIKQVESMILDTKMVPAGVGLLQTPTSELASYLLDADLSNLGREDFFEKLDLICEERGLEKESFYRSTLGFLTRHKWHTQIANDLRSERKAQNIQKLKDIVSSNSS